MKAKPFNLFLLSFLLISCTSNSNNEESNSQVDNPQIEEAFEYYTELKEIYDNSINNKEITLKSFQYYGLGEYKAEEIDFKETKREVKNLQYPNENTNIIDSSTYFYEDSSNGVMHYWKTTKVFNDYFNDFIQNTSFNVDEINNDLGVFNIYNESLGIIDVYYDGTIGYTKENIHYISNHQLDTFFSFLEYIQTVTINLEETYSLKDGKHFFDLLKVNNASLFCNKKKFEMEKIYELFLDNVQLFSNHSTLYINSPIPFSLEGIQIQENNVNTRKTIINKDGYVIRYSNIYRKNHYEMLSLSFKDQYAGMFEFDNLNAFFVYPFKIGIDKLIWIFK